MAAGILRTDSPDDRGSAEPASADAALEALLGRTVAELDGARAELALALQLRTRLLDEIERLERRLRDAEAERLALLEKVSHRDRILSQIFGSRSWRWAQALRRIVGRS